MDDIRIPIWTCRLSGMGLVDLHVPAVRDHYNLTPNDLTADSWSACQRGGAQIRAAGARGVLAPSAALANAVNVTIFGPRRAIALNRRPALASAVPAAIVAIGRPPTQLVAKVLRRASSPTLF